MAAGAVRSPLPERIAPQLATLATHAPARPEDWSYEIKFDGYRLLARFENGTLTLHTRNGHDWSAKMPALHRALSRLEVDSCWLDGEIVVMNDAGLPDFSALQSVFDARFPDASDPVTYFVFDLLYLNGVDLRPVPLSARRALLAELMAPLEDKRVLLSQDFAQDPHDVLASACKLKLEGVIAKRRDGSYHSGRSLEWLKLKCVQRQEFVVCGFTTRRGTGQGLRALLLALHDEDGRLRYAGKVPLPLKGQPKRRLEEALRALQTERCPVADPPPAERDRIEHWVEPRRIAEVSFLEWTHDGGIRHGLFHGLRLDKPARDIVREHAVDPDAGAHNDAGPAPRSELQPDPPPGPDGKTRGISVAGVRISNPARVLDEVSAQTKLDLARYYDAIAEWALPHLTHRPLALVRAPDGIQGELFFQKHAERMTFGAITRLPAEYFPGHQPLLEIHTREALVGAAQMGVIELHTWNASQPDLAHPDRVVFDLDPDPTLPWSAMIEAAQLTKVVLDELGLKSWPKTSGGKGLHLVVPLDGKQGWDEVKDFSQAVARHLAHVLPERFSAVLGPKNRVGKIFVDYLRNGLAQSTIAAFSVRARPGLSVSVPFAWDELLDIKRADQWSMRTAVEHMRGLGVDPWQDYWKTRRQRITARMRKAV